MSESVSVPPAVSLPPVERAAVVRARLTWLLVFRSLVVTALVGTGITLKATSAEDLLFARASLALYAIAGAAYLTILAGALWLRLLGVRGIVAVAYGQLVADAVIASALVSLTGGVESVFVFLYSLSVLNAAIILERRGAMVVATTATVLYAAVLASEIGSFDALAPSSLLPSFATNAGSFFLVAVLGGYLTGQLSRASERLQTAQAELRKLEGLYEAVLGSLPSGVVSIDASGRVVYANHAGMEILDDAALIGGRLVERHDGLHRVVTADAQPRFELALEVARRGQRVIGGSVAPLVGVEDAGRVIVFQDLTELRRLQEEVARAERLAALGRVAAGLAHEVRNPLAAMVGCLHLLRADGSRLDVDSQRMLEIVQREAERLSMLVQDFLTYARPAPPRVAAVELRPLLEETIATARVGLKAASVNVMDVPDVVVRCDPDQLRQVLWNIVGNADVVIAGAGRAGVVEVSARVASGALELCVDDDGPGVADDVRSRIFEPFFTTRPEGNGLGLATSQQLMQQNGGSISLETAPSGGARFTIRVPLDGTSHPPGAALDPAPPATSSS